MAKPIAFKPVTVDFKADLLKKLDAAPETHAEALLAAYNVLEAAHEEGLLDLLRGAIGARDTIFAKLSEYAKTPEGITGIRNLLEAGKILTKIDPEVLDQFSNVALHAAQEHKTESKPPSMWQIAKRAMSEDGRRGLSFATLLLTGLGKSLKNG
jgi:uncharacterized protein YjgD (DUF1641 family)